MNNGGVYGGIGELARGINISSRTLYLVVRALARRSGASEEAILGTLARLADPVIDADSPSRAHEGDEDAEEPPPRR